MAILATCPGYPRIGVNRELKKALEPYWSSHSTGLDLEKSAAALRCRHWSTMKAAGIGHIPSGDTSQIE